MDTLIDRTTMKDKLERANGHNREVLIIGDGRDEHGNLYLKFKVKGSPVNVPAIRVDEIIEKPTKLYKSLANAGAKLFSKSVQAELIERIQSRPNEEPKFDVATRLGYLDGCFVMPGEQFGESKLPIEVSLDHLDQQMLGKYRCRGSLQEWKNKIGIICKNNARLMFGVSLALTGPILRYVKGPRSGGFQIVGPGGAGKTGAAMVAGSVWGCHRLSERKEKGFAESWHTTANKVEITALAHNETLLILDETKTAGGTDARRGEIVLEVSFNLSEGTVKERLTEGSARAWRLYFLSTSNYSLDQLGAFAKQEIADAERGRLIDIPCPKKGQGIYENLYGFSDGAALTDALKARCRSVFGTPGREFLHKLTAERLRDHAGLKKVLRRDRKRYLKRIKKKATNLGLKPLERASARFASVYAAGSLGIRYGILPWAEKELLKAILSCQIDGLNLDGDSGGTPGALRSQSPSVADLKERLVAYLKKDRSKFLDLRKRRPKLGEHEFGSTGYLAERDDKEWLYLPFEIVEKLAGNRSSAHRLLDALAAEGLFVKPGTGYVEQQRIYDGGKGTKNLRRVVALRTSILGERV